VEDPVGIESAFWNTPRRSLLDPAADLRLTLLMLFLPLMFVSGGFDALVSGHGWAHRAGGALAVLVGIAVLILDLLHLARPATVPRDPSLTSEFRTWLRKRREGPPSPRS
jgi:hypothetical protein